MSVCGVCGVCDSTVCENVCGVCKCVCERVRNMGTCVVCVSGLCGAGLVVRLLSVLRQDPGGGGASLLRGQLRDPSLDSETKTLCWNLTSSKMAPSTGAPGAHVFPSQGLPWSLTAPTAGLRQGTVGPSVRTRPCSLGDALRPSRQPRGPAPGAQAVPSASIPKGCACVAF